MTLGDPVCTRCACRFTSCACVDDRIASEMQDIKGPSEMVRLVPEGRAERQVAAVREVLGWHHPLYGDEARDLHDAIRAALETE